MDIDKNEEQNLCINQDSKVALGNLIKSIFIFMIPMLKFVEFRIVGNLFLPDIILLFIFIFMIMNSKICIKEKTARLVILFCVVWLCGQIATDLIRDTQFKDYIRGWAKIFFTIINFTAILSLLKNRTRLILVFAFGIAVGNVLEYIINPSGYAVENVWKFGVGVSITWLFVLISAMIPATKYFVKISLLAIVSMINLYMGFRSLSGICFLSTILIGFQWLRCSKYSRNIEISSINGYIYLLVLIFASYCFITGYGFLAQKGFLGEKASQIYEWQAYGQLGLIIGGRSEILASGRAILDSPIIGHGSWAKNYKYADALVDLKHALGYYPLIPDEEGLIPSHSHLFGAWVESGILGAVFWMFVITLPVKCINQLLRKEESLSPLYAFICFFLIWDVLFSPYSGDRRFITPYYIVTIITALSGMKKAGQYSQIDFAKSFIR